MIKIKAYMAYSTSGGGLFAYLVLENGCALFDHYCSNESFIYGDLWGNRKERQETIKKMGYELDIQKGFNKIPEEVLEKNKTPEEYNDFLALYEKHSK